MNTEWAHHLGPSGSHLRGILSQMWPEAARALPAEARADWLAAVRRLAEGGLGGACAIAYLRHSPACAQHLGPASALALARSMEAIGDLAGASAAHSLAVAAPKAAVLIGAPGAFRDWLAVLERLAALAPDALLPVLERSETVLADLDVARFEAWIMGGLQSAGDEADRRRFFSLADPRARNLLRQEADEMCFADQERRLRAYVTALFGGRPLVRSVGARGGDPVPRRVSFGDGMVQVPESFRGVLGGKASELYRAALAHVAAHLTFTPERFPVGSLKPLQVALVSLVEDARVERLAIGVLPGLRRLWLPFHVAEPSGAPIAPLLMARLARALIDDDYDDPDAWVNKGRALFMEARSHWHDPAVSRRIGGLLGNDLGQMRVQFNPRTYVVEPPYRDDNAGLWDNAEPPPHDQADAVPEGMRSERQGERDQDPAAPPEEEAAIPVARYPEWDHRLGRERPDWTTVVDTPARIGDAALTDFALQRHADTASRIRALVRSARVSRPTRMRRQPEGEALDLDACIAAAVSRRCRETPDPRVYATSLRRHRDLSVLVLLDVSESTNDAVKGGGASVIALERDATALLSEAMSGLGDPFAIRAFCSNTRDEVRYVRVKDFTTPWDRAAKSRLAGLTGSLSTRMGAALRHAGKELQGRSSHRRLLLVVTDGEPSDVDMPDRRYLVEDARKAVQQLAANGIDVFCVGLDAGGDSYLSRIFGRRNVIQIDRLERLPERLPMLYLRLTA